MGLSIRMIGALISAADLYSQRVRYDDALMVGISMYKLGPEKARAMAACHMLKEFCDHPSGHELKKHLVDVGGRDLSGVFEAFDQHAQQHGAALRACRDRKVIGMAEDCAIDAGPGRHATAAMRLLGQYFVSVHWGAPELGGWGEIRQSASEGAPPTVTECK